MLSKISNLIIFLFLISFSNLSSQVFQYHKINENTNPNYQFRYHSRVKYDHLGNIYILSYDGRRFYEMNNKNGYLSTPKPIGRAITSGTALTHYDFDVDTSGIVHIAFAYHSIESQVANLYYTNSQLDTAYFLGSDQLPLNDILMNSFKLNVIRSNDNKIIVNYIHFFLGRLSPPTPWSRLSWTQLINPSQNNIIPNKRIITIQYPNEFQYSYRPYINVFANKELFVQLLFNHVRSNDTLEIRHIFNKYSFQDSTSLIDYTFIAYVGNRTPNNPLIHSVPLFKENYGNEAVHISSIRISAYPGNSFRSDPLSDKIATLDRQNNLHVLAYNPNLNSFEYYRFTNLPFGDFSNNSLYHRVDGTKFYPFNLSSQSFINQSIGGLAALNSNDVVFLFNNREYLIRQKQGIFNYYFILPYDLYSIRTLHSKKHENKIYLLNSRDSYIQLNDSTGAIYFYELLQLNNQFVGVIDTSNIKRVILPARLGLQPRFASLRPIVKVDKNQIIHLLIFKVIGYNNIAGLDLGQWYYYRLNQNLILEGGYNVTVNDTLTLSTPLDYDIDDNGIVHFIYLKYTNNNKTVIRYTNNSSGSFINPIQVGDTISSINSSIWISIKATRSGNAYVVYRPYVPSGVYVCYGNQNGFSIPKRLFVSENLDRFGGRNKVGFDVDYSDALHVFDVVSSYFGGNNIYRDVVVYSYKVIRDSVVIISPSFGLFTDLVNTQCILLERDRNGIVHVTGYQQGKVFYLNSQNNFTNVNTYNLNEFGIFKYLRSNELPFMDNFKVLFTDETQNKIYITFGSALNDEIVAWMPYSTTGIEKNEKITPSDFVLYQNYPNPFNPNTKIEFEIPYRENVKIVIYDLLGREVLKAIDKELEVGKYSIDINMTGYASGVYLYRLEAGKFNKTKKMLLVK